MTAVTDTMSIPAARPQRKTPKGTFDIVFRNASLISALFVLLLLAGIMLLLFLRRRSARRVRHRKVNSEKPIDIIYESA